MHGWRGNRNVKAAEPNFGWGWTRDDGSLLGFVSIDLVHSNCFFWPNAQFVP